MAIPIRPVALGNSQMKIVSQCPKKSAALSILEITSLLWLTLPRATIGGISTCCHRSLILIIGTFVQKIIRRCSISLIAESLASIIIRLSLCLSKPMAVGAQEKFRANGDFNLKEKDIFVMINL